jgi:phosphate transport system substrate-binding protein
MRILKAVLTVTAFVMGFCLQAHAQDKLLINGAGATFPAPIYSKWFQEYNKANPKVEINYQSIGSGGGIKQLTAKTVDFGASDAPMSDGEITAAGGNVVHIPTVLGAVTITYNVPGVKSSLNFDGQTVAELFMGKITKWNDPKIAALNKGVALPDTAVVPVYRSDSSGTTSVFTEYLAKVSSDWKSTVGQGKTVKWPAGLGGKGNEGVTGQVKNTPGAVGYVELSYAIAEKLPTGLVKNKSGQFVSASLDSVSAAAAGALKTMPEDFRVSITDAEGKTAYPIAAFTYLLIYKDMPGAKGQEFVKFLGWAMDAGQKQAPTLQYAPLPGPMIAKVKEKIKTINAK